MLTTLVQTFQDYIHTQLAEPLCSFAEQHSERLDNQSMALLVIRCHPHTHIATHQASVLQQMVQIHTQPDASLRTGYAMHMQRKFTAEAQRDSIAGASSCSFQESNPLTGYVLSLDASAACTSWAASTNSQPCATGSTYLQERCSRCLRRRRRCGGVHRVGWPPHRLLSPHSERAVPCERQDKPGCRLGSSHCYIALLKQSSLHGNDLVHGSVEERLVGDLCAI